MFTETLEFDRRGEFSLDTTGEYHCSTMAHPRIKYRVFIRATCDVLDERGFMLDQLDCPRYFNSIQTTNLSCELLTEKACRDLWGICLGENAKLVISHMEVSLSPEPFEITITKRRHDPDAICKI